MKWFQNLKLSAKLLVSFVAVIVLAIAIGAFALYELSVVNHRLEAVVSSDLPSIVTVGAIDGAINGIRRREYRYAVTTDEAEKSTVEEEIAERQNRITTLMQQYDAFMSDEERSIAEEFLTRWSVYEGLRERAFQLYREGREADSDALIVGASGAAFEDANELMEQLIEVNERLAAESAASAQGAFRGARTMILLALLLAAGAGVGIALYVSRLIGRPVVALAAASRSLAAGDVDVVIDYAGKDEVGDLAQSFREMVAAQKQMASAATSVAAGDMSVEVRPRGERDALGRAFVELRRVIQALLGETTVLIAAAKDGELAQRADTQAFKGGYAELLRGINDLLDAVTRPIDEASRTLEKLAARDLSARMSGEYRGDFARIKDAVNTAATNLDEALSDVAVSSEQVAGASDQISAGSQLLAEGASEQASALEEVSSSLQEMASMSRQNAANAREARTLAEAARNGAGRGVESMKRLSGAVTRIKESSDATAKIVKTIDEIAFQTNLLALNAAVEAARAGDAGKGFAVVAEEVRNLAMRSAEAAKNTANLIEDAVRNADSGVEINADVMTKLQEIDAGVNKVGEVMAEITAASEQQTQGVDQISAAVEQMNTVTQQTAANSEESASAAEELSGQAERMRELVGGFTLSHARPARTTARPGVEAARSGRPAVTLAAPKKKNGRNGKGNGNGHTPRFDAAAVIPFGDQDDMDALSEF